MHIRFKKYQGTGNDFVMIDDRGGEFPAENYKLVARLCHRRFGIGADGLILVRAHPDCDFEMRYYNADGQPGSMCGNGGRCAVMFARQLGIFKNSCRFMASDGLHRGQIQNGKVRLQMQDVASVQCHDGYFFADTGSPHYVAFVDDVDTFPVVEQGRKIRQQPAFAPGGTNVNFVTRRADLLDVRTYERGVEDETWACGTGATAVALVAALQNSQSPVMLKVKGGQLQVAFERQGKAFKNIYLTGPATHVFSGEVTL